MTFLSESYSLPVRGRARAFAPSLPNQASRLPILATLEPCPVPIKPPRDPVAHPYTFPCIQAGRGDYQSQGGSTHE